MLKRIEEAWARLLSLVEWVTWVLVVLLTAVVLSQMGARLFRISIQWPIEMSRVLFTWLGFLGIIVAMTRGEVPGFSLFIQRLPSRVRHVTEVLTHTLVVVFLVSLFSSTFRTVRIAHAQSMSVLPLQWSYLYVSLSVALFILIVMYVIRLLRLVARSSVSRPNDA
jgi:TRAP-type C4-dicarboxylate transport system permease small subunit